MTDMDSWDAENKTDSAEMRLLKCDDFDGSETDVRRIYLLKNIGHNKNFAIVHGHGCSTQTSIPECKVIEVLTEFLSKKNFKRFFVFKLWKDDSINICYQSGIISILLLLN